MEKVSICSYVRTTEDAVRGFSRRSGSITWDGVLKQSFNDILFYSTVRAVYTNL